VGPAAPFLVGAVPDSLTSGPNTSEFPLVAWRQISGLGQLDRRRRGPRMWSQRPILDSKLMVCFRDPIRGDDTAARVKTTGTDCSALTVEPAP